MVQVSAGSRTTTPANTPTRMIHPCLVLCALLPFTSEAPPASAAVRITGVKPGHPGDSSVRSWPAAAAPSSHRFHARTSVSFVPGTATAVSSAAVRPLDCARDALSNVEGRPGTRAAPIELSGPGHSAPEIGAAIAVLVHP